MLGIKRYFSTHILLFFLLIITGYSQMFHSQYLRFRHEPPNRVDFSNSSGKTVLCSAEGNPIPTVRWTKQDGENLEELPGLRYTRHDGSLVFEPFSSEEYRADIHASVYRCEASNRLGIIGSRDVHVRATVLQNYEIHLVNDFVIKGNMALLRCTVPSYVTDYVKVTSWERSDGFLITPGIISAKYGMLDNGNLYIQDAIEHDGSYSFRCHTENEITKEKRSSEDYSRIIVTEPHHEIPPRIAVKLKIVKVSSGHRATLSCIAQGFPPPTYRWQKASEDIRLFPDHSVSVSQEGGVLIFHKAQRNDSGLYKCHAVNGVGEDTVDTELVVEEFIHASLVPAEQRLEIGATSTLNCSVIGNPTGIVFWKKDMNALSPSQRAHFPNPYQLKIRQIRRQDAGMYQCFVRRETFSSQASARLIIGDLPPSIKLGFPEKTIRPGTYVSLTCIATGHPEPTIKWILDNRWPLSTKHGILISSYQVSNGNIVSSINFTSVDVTDSGLYTCEAVNDAGSVSYAKRLNVFGPLFVRTMNDVIALSGEGFQSLCPFGGYPYDSIIWKKGNQMLPINQRQQIFPNGTFLISGMQPLADEGIYSCEVTSGLSSVPVSRSFSVMVRTKPKITKFTFPDELQEGMRIAVTCVVIAGDGPLSTRWFKDGLSLDGKNLDASVMESDDGFVSTLTIKYLTHKHSGNYTCIAKNDVASGTYSSVLTVKVPPRWVLEPKDTYAIAGQSAIINCQADGVPQPYVRWKVASDHPPNRYKTIVSTSHVHILVNGSLSFRNIESTDAGFYLCEANNGVAVGLSKVVRLTVQRPPKFNSKFQFVSAKKGEKCVIECFALGDLPMRITWRRNSQFIDLAGENRYLEKTEEIMESGLKTFLIVEKTQRKDSALFECIAINEFGEDVMNIKVTIEDIPDAPQNLEVHDVTSRSIRLTWDKPFDGNSPINQYTVMWRLANGQTSGGPLSVTGTETTITVRGLKPKTKYFFRVKCLNLIGESQFGAEMAVTTLEEPPRVPPRLVKAIGTSSRSVNVSWQLPAAIEDEAHVEGFYVGYKLSSSSEPFTFIPVDNLRTEIDHFCEVNNLNRKEEYHFIVQSFNKKGASPPSESVKARTLEFDRPLPPVIKNHYATSSSIKVVWEYQNIPSAPVTGFILRHKTDSSPWKEIIIPGLGTSFSLYDLLCGTKYHCSLVATNKAGRGNSSEIVSVRTIGSAPLAPDKRALLTVNSSTVLINLNSWHSGGCFIRFFIIQYKVRGNGDWILVSNEVLPEQKTVTITDLTPGTWYSLLITARNDAGSTDAEYVFATLTLSGKYPPHISEVVGSSGLFYNHLTITVPVISSVTVVIFVFCTVCIVTKKKSPRAEYRTAESAERNETVKQENIPLSDNYESAQEPAYFPMPYSTNRVTSFDREHYNRIHGTLDSQRSENLYKVPSSPRRKEKEECVYATPCIVSKTPNTGHRKSRGSSNFDRSQ
ncbi:cell adhesion molecule Dscam1 isoform X2 [Parasteatoda tepidariorum]